MKCRPSEPMTIRLNIICTLDVFAHSLFVNDLNFSPTRPDPPVSTFGDPPSSTQTRLLYTSSRKASSKLRGLAARRPEWASRRLGEMHLNACQESNERCLLPCLLYPHATASDVLAVNAPVNSDLTSNNPSPIFSINFAGFYSSH